MGLCFAPGTYAAVVNQLTPLFNASAAGRDEVEKSFLLGLQKLKGRVQFEPLEGGIQTNGSNQGRTFHLGRLIANRGKVSIRLWKDPDGVILQNYLSVGLDRYPLSRWFCEEDIEFLLRVPKELFGADAYGI